MSVGTLKKLKISERELIARLRKDAPAPEVLQAAADTIEQLLNYKEQFVEIPELQLGLARRPLE